MNVRIDAGHVAHLLPGYAGGTLGPDDRRRVRDHLPGCPTCRAELAAWQAIGAAARDAYGDESPEDDAPLRAVWRRIDATTDETRPSRAAAERAPRPQSVVPTPSRSGPIRRPLIRRSLNQLAMAALLLLTLAGVYVSFVPHGPDPDGAPSVASDVPMFRGGPARTGAIAGPGPAGEPVERWSISAPPEQYGQYASPVVSDGLVFLSRAAGLVAVDAKTGFERWYVDLGGVGVSTPTVADGTVYAGSMDGNLYALDAASGEERWRARIGVVWASSPAVVDGTLYVATGESGASPAVAGGLVYIGDGFGSVLVAVDVERGRERWRFAPTAPGLYAVDAATGRQRWHFQTERRVNSAPAVAGGLVVFGDFDDRLYAVEASTGQERWRVQVGEDSDRKEDPGAVLTLDAAPAVAGGLVFATGWDGTLVAIDATRGTARWQTEIGYGTQSSPVVADGVLYIGGMDGILYALDATAGEPRWQLALDGPIGASPAVVEGVVYVTQGDGVLVAFA